MKRSARAALGCFIVLALSFGFRFAEVSRSGEISRPWHAAARHSAEIAPDPVHTSGTAIVQVYSAPTYGWRGLVAQHPWIIFKRAGEKAFTRYDVIGWRGRQVVQRNHALPDGLWYGRRPALLADHRGKDAEAMILRIEAAIQSYPFADFYRAYPGPNSNTFLAHIGRQVPELRLDLPANSIGKDYRPLGDPLGLSPSGSGVQLSILGLLGASIGLQEGVEINLLGLDFGIDWNSPGLRLPFVGRIGMDDTSVSVTHGSSRCRNPGAFPRPPA
jgi:hypothetical protein